MNQEEHTLLLHKVNFKISMLRYSLRDNSDAYILVKGNITVNNTAPKGSAANNTNKKAIFKNCAPLTDCINKINNTQADNAKSIDTLLLDKINFKTSMLRYSLRDNCEVNAIVTWPADCIINYINVANQVLTFAITETNL